MRSTLSRAPFHPLLPPLAVGLAVLAVALPALPAAAIGELPLPPPTEVQPVPEPQAGLIRDWRSRACLRTADLGSAGATAADLQRLVANLQAWDAINHAAWAANQQRVGEAGLQLARLQAQAAAGPGANEGAESFRTRIAGDLQAAQTELAAARAAERQLLGNIFTAGTAGFGLSAQAALQAAFQHPDCPFEFRYLTGLSDDDRAAFTAAWAAKDTGAWSEDDTRKWGTLSFTLGRLAGYGSEMAILRQNLHARMPELVGMEEKLFPTPPVADEPPEPEPAPEPPAPPAE